MTSGQYDKDCLTWDPQGDIRQIKHALEAVKMGTAVVGLRSNTHAVLVASKKQGGQGSASEFASHDKKIFHIDDHCGCGISGLTADARVLVEYMRGECLNNKYVFDSPMQVGRLVSQIGDKAATKTMKIGKRPFGIGLLINAYDESGPHIYQTLPSGDYYEFYAMSMGNRSQSAKTYLEKNFETFGGCSEEQLIRHGVKALHVTSEQDKELSPDNMDVAVVGKDREFKLLDEKEKQRFLDEIKQQEGGGNAAADAMDES